MLSMKAKYALRALSMMAKSNDHVVQAKDIARLENVPKKFLEQILLDLKRSGLVVSRRGVMGGYNLNKKPAEIMIGDVIRLMDGPLAPIRCASIYSYQKCIDCKDEKTCAIRKVMFEVRNAISEVLDNKSILELAELSGPETEGWPDYEI